MREGLSAAAGIREAPRTAGIGEIGALSGLRGLAALWVMIYHCWALAGTPPPVLQLGAWRVDFTLPISLGWAGVDIFFVLSAFLLALPFAEARAGLVLPRSLSEYFRRRALRILPAYYAQLSVLLVLAFGFGIGRKLGLGEFLAHLGVLFYVTAPPVAPLVGVWYTLTPECLFYLVLPLAALWLRPRRWPLLLGLALASMLAYRYWVSGPLGYLPIGERVNLLMQLPARIDEFMIGALLAYATVHAGLREGAGRRSNEGMVMVALLGGVALALWLQREAEGYWQGAPIHYVWHGLFALAVGMNCAAAVRGSALAGFLLGGRVLRFFGRISFSLYLWHFPIFQWLAGAGWLQRWPGGAAVHLVFVGIPVVVLAAWVSYSCIERPGLRWAHRRRHPGTTPAAA